MTYESYCECGKRVKAHTHIGLIVRKVAHDLVRHRHTDGTATRVDVDETRK